MSNRTAEGRGIPRRYVRMRGPPPAPRRESAARGWESGGAMSASALPTASPRTRSAALLIVTVLVVAANMRPTITSVGPVIDRIGADTGLGSAALGLLGAIPVLAFAAVSPLVARLSRRIGPEAAVLVALVVLVLATVLRSLPGWTGLLWIGTALIGGAIAVANVLVPAIVKTDFPDRVAVATGAYSSALGLVAAAASGLAIPLAQAAGWRIAVGGWAALAVVGIVVWSLRFGRGSGARLPAAPPSTAPVWRSGTAWWCALFMGLQSTIFYSLVTWLPTLERGTGIAPLVAGWHLSLFSALGVVSGLAITAVLHGRSDLRIPAVAVSAGMAVGMGGLLLVPSLAILWVTVAGLASGASLVIALTFVGIRARTSADSARLSGMVQGVGYLLAALGPFGVGLLLDVTGAWQAGVVAVGIVGLLQCIPAWFAGRDRVVEAS